MLHPDGDTGLATQASAPVGAWPHRVLGGAGLLVLIVVLLSIPLMLAVRNAARRRHRDQRMRDATEPIDAWSESARRMKDAS